MHINEHQKEKLWNDMLDEYIDLYEKVEKEVEALEQNKLKHALREEIIQSAAAKKVNNNPSVHKEIINLSEVAKMDRKIEELSNVLTAYDAVIHELKIKLNIRF